MPTALLHRYPPRACVVGADQLPCSQRMAGAAARRTVGYIMTIAIQAYRGDHLRPSYGVISALDIAGVMAWGGA